MTSNIVQIQEILNGYKVDKKNIQSVDNMTVIPIVSDTEFTNVADVNDVELTRDLSYDRLEFKNSSGKIGIALQGWAVIDNSQHAQDRTIPYAHLIKAANAKVLPANCIQARQMGHFDASRLSDDNFLILPPSLRGIAIRKATYTTSQVGALWDTLATWSKGIDCHSNGLTYFYSRFEDRLNQFVAEFEPVEKQLGAIVLINGEVVAVDIMPKYESWKEMWRALIRDSYGAEAIRLAENSGAVSDRPAMKMDGIESLDDLEKEFNKSKNEFYDELQTKFNQVAQLSVGYQTEETVGELSMMKLENEEFVGQAVLHGSNHFVYLSLVSSNMESKPKKAFKSLRTNPYTSSTFSFN
jgi:hypothetical protein